MKLDIGPNIFRQRLGKFNNNLKLLNPNFAEIKKINDKKVSIVARLDGVNYLYGSPDNYGNYLKSRNFFLLSYFVKILPNFFFNRYLQNIINNRLNRSIIWLLNNSKAFIFQSKISLKMHKKFLNFKKRKYTIICNGVDINEFKPRKKKFSQTKYIIISASTFRPHKRLHEAIKLINFLSNIYPKIKLHILGELDSVTKEIIKNYDLSNCIFYGRVHYLKLPKYYNCCDIQIHPAIFDPCPNVVVEGLASGLPVITPVQSGAYELISKNRDWSINEHIKLEYKKLYCIKNLPEIPLEKYAKKIINIFNNLDYHKRRARLLAEKNLDIKIVKKKYLKFMKSILDNNI